MPKALSKPIQSPPSSTLLRDLLIAAGLFILAILVRLPVMAQGLWYDELFTLLNFIRQSWGEIVIGRYSPNNHILFTLLAKLFMPASGDITDIAMAIRMPSLLAGSAVAVALAWPLRTKRPVLALLIGVIAATHPWLISFSGWARGYALLMFLVVLATAFLPARKRLVNWAYAICLTAALYTQPLALVLVPAHGLAMLLCRKKLLVTWLRSICVAGVMSFCLYLPLFATAREYFSQPGKPMVTYGQFVEQSIRFVQAGDNATGLVYVITPLLILVAGAIMAWRTDELRPWIISFGGASILTILVPLVLPTAGEVRAMLWLIPLYCIGAGALVDGCFAARPVTSGDSDKTPTPPPRRGLVPWLGAVAGVVLVAALGMRDYVIWRIPAQPIPEAINLARQEAGEKGTVIGVYMASGEAAATYGGLDAYAYKPASLQLAEEKATGPVVAVVFYDDLIRRKEPELWEELQKRYTLVQRLPGRISSAAVYRREGRSHR